MPHKSDVNKPNRTSKTGTDHFSKIHWQYSPTKNKAQITLIKIENFYGNNKLIAVKSY